MSDWASWQPRRKAEETTVPRDGEFSALSHEQMVLRAPTEPHRAGPGSAELPASRAPMALQGEAAGPVPALLALAPTRQA